MTKVDAHLRRFLPERSEPKPANQLDAWMDEQAGEELEPAQEPEPSQATWADRALIGIGLAATAAFWIGAWRAARAAWAWMAGNS